MPNLKDGNGWSVFNICFTVAGITVLAATVIVALIAAAIEKVMWILNHGG